MKNHILILILAIIYSNTLLAQVPSKNDYEYSKIDFYFDSLYTYKFKEYKEGKNKNEITKVYKELEHAINNSNTVKRIELTNSTISKLPKGFEKLVEVEEVVFRNCKKIDLKDVFKKLAKLPKLKRVEISYCSKYLIANNISLLKQVDEISLKANKFVLLPESFSELINLKILDVSENANINENIMFEVLEKMPNLKTLKADYCHIRSIPDVTYHLTNLSLAGNLLKTLPLNATKIVKLNLSSNVYLNQENLFKNLGSTNKVKSLKLNDCYIKGIHSNIGKMTSLEYLSLVGNNLSSLPNEIGNLYNLKHLDISTPKIATRGNAIESLPPSFGNLENLEILLLARNKISTLPSEFSRLRNLKKLDLYLNNLNSFPKSILKLGNLEYLNLGLTEINVLPENIGDLVNLEYLNLKGNFFINYKLKIKTIPNSFGNLKKLKYLNFSDNVIEHLPENFGNLVQLETFNIKDNLLSSLPASFGSLQQLQELNIKANEIVTLPIEFSNLKKLSLFNISFNIKLDTKSVATIIGKIPSLKIVDISDSYFEEKTVTSLKSKLPNTTFKALNIVK